MKKNKNFNSFIHQFTEIAEEEKLAFMQVFIKQGNNPFSLESFLDLSEKLIALLQLVPAQQLSNFIKLTFIREAIDETELYWFHLANMLSYAGYNDNERVYRLIEYLESKNKLRKDLDAEQCMLLLIGLKPEKRLNYFYFLINKAEFAFTPLNAENFLRFVEIFSENTEDALKFLKSSFAQAQLKTLTLSEDDHTEILACFPARIRNSVKNQLREDVSTLFFRNKELTGEKKEVPAVSMSPR